MEWDIGEVEPLFEENPQIKHARKENLVKVIRMYKCMICDGKFTSKTDLAEHKLTHTSIKPFECLYCDYRSSLKDIMKNHISIQHGITMKRRDIITYKKYETIIQEYKCTICDGQFSSKKDLHAHHIVNKGCRPFACSHCDNHNSSNENRSIVPKDENIADVSVKDEPISDEEIFEEEVEKGIFKKSRIIYKCTICTKQFYSKSTLYRHNLSHYGSKPFGCPHCDYRSALRGIMKNHLGIRHNISVKITDIIPDKKDKMFIRAYKCMSCDKILTSKERLQKHLFISKDCKPFKCLFCYYRCSLKYTLKRHVQRKHNIDLDNTSVISTKDDGIKITQTLCKDTDDSLSEIKLEIGSSQILPDVSFKEENIYEEGLSDIEMKYDINTEILFDEKEAFNSRDNKNSPTRNSNNEDIYFDSYIKEEILTGE